MQLNGKAFNEHCRNFDVVQVSNQSHVIANFTESHLHIEFVCVKSFRG